MTETTLTLNNGISIPQLALGTWLIPDEAVAKPVKTAIRLGYRHVDTAQAYGNERGVGEGVRTSGVPREEIFVTSKIAAENKTYESTAESIDKTLADMGLDYIDMLIIHSPQPWAEVNQSDNRYFAENREVWRALEDAYKAKKVRAIGVSNFQIEDVENILATCRVKPMVNQVLAHISNTPIELIRYCQERDIAVEAYSPVAHGEAIKNPLIVETASKYGVTPAQLCIRYCIQLGLIALPKASSEQHIQENAAVDFVISDEDMDALLHCEKIKDYGEASFFPVYGGKL